MTPDTVVDLFSEAMLLVVAIASIMILPSLVVGLIVSMFQAATQINEQTLSFLPRLIVTIMALVVTGSWIVRKIIDFTHRLMLDLPGMLG